MQVQMLQAQKQSGFNAVKHKHNANVYVFPNEPLNVLIDEFKQQFNLITSSGKHNDFKDKVENIIKVMNDFDVFNKNKNKDKGLIDQFKDEVNSNYENIQTHKNIQFISRSVSQLIEWNVSGNKDRPLNPCVPACIYDANEINDIDDGFYKTVTITKEMVQNIGNTLVNEIFALAYCSNKCFNNGKIDDIKLFNTYIYDLFRQNVFITLNNKYNKFFELFCNIIKSINDTIDANGNLKNILSTNKIYIKNLLIYSFTNLVFGLITLDRSSYNFNEVHSTNIISMVFNEVIENYTIINNNKIKSKSSFKEFYYDDLDRSIKSIYLNEINVKEYISDYTDITDISVIKLSKISKLINQINTYVFNKIYYKTRVIDGKSFDLNITPTSSEKPDIKSMLFNNIGISDYIKKINTNKCCDPILTTFSNDLVKLSTNPICTSLLIINLAMLTELTDNIEKYYHRIRIFRKLYSNETNEINLIGYDVDSTVYKIHFLVKLYNIRAEIDKLGINHCYYNYLNNTFVSYFKQYVYNNDLTEAIPNISALNSIDYDNLNSIFKYILSNLINKNFNYKSFTDKVYKIYEGKEIFTTNIDNLINTINTVIYKNTMDVIDYIIQQDLNDYLTINIIVDPKNFKHNDFTKEQRLFYKIFNNLNNFFNVADKILL